MQAIYDIASICAAQGINEAILSPGSRCAPLTISFARHPEINVRTISDERSAGFIATGIALQSNKPVVLICTSGSAGLNYAPAVAEAFYQQIPLVIMTADRPPEWIDQLDGQTVRQVNLFGAHVKASYQTPVDTTHSDARWHVNRIVNEAILQSNTFPAGPVHINIPLREPFYPEGEIEFTPVPRTVQEVQPTLSIAANEVSNLQEALLGKKILIVPGQQRQDLLLSSAIDKFARDWDAVVVADQISNTGSMDNVIRMHDTILSAGKEDLLAALSPEIIISFGKSIISKSLKQFLRNSKGTHWHIQEAGTVADTYQHLQKIIRVKPEVFFLQLKSKETQHQSSFCMQWKNAEELALKHTNNFFTRNIWSEFSAIHHILNNIPNNSILHLANSMPVRYANYLPFPKEKQVEVFCNRGTSGIDGTNSTALGACLAVSKLVTVITGDMAFFYDRNAFWNKYLPSHLRVIILNNGGGGIFRMISGPSSQPELEEYFVTRQQSTAKQLAEEYEIQYLSCDKQDDLTHILKDFYSASDRPKILEVMTDGEINTKEFQYFKANIPTTYVK